MSDDFYTVMVISTINSMYGSFSPEERFQHTLKCIESVKEKIPGAKTLFVDNSNGNVKDEWRQIIAKQVEVAYFIPHNLFSLQANMSVRYKSQSEANMLYEGLEMLKQSNMIGKRIFKISGRYQIADTFDIKEYENPEMEGKFTFVPTQMASWEDDPSIMKKTMWFEQALISFQEEHISLFQRQLFGMLAHMNRTGDCIEETMFYYIPHEKVFPIQKAHVTGVKAQDRGVVSH
jgi:hypothetical protein